MSHADEAQRLYDEAMRLAKGRDVNDPQMAAAFRMLRQAAEMNHPDACEAMFVALSKVNPKESYRWFHRAERAKQGLPNSPATDKTPGGCAGLIVLGLVALGASLSGWLG